MGGGQGFASAARPEGEEGLQYHLRVKRGDVARYVLLPGDPERTDLIASLWDEARLVAHHREFRTWTGVYKGVRISVTSTGIGSPSAVIAVEELLRVGADTFIRVGTMGGLARDLEPGTLVIATGAVRLEGTSKQYVMAEYPAVASYDVVSALVEAAEALGAEYRVGIVASTDSFYLGQGRPGFKGYMNPRAASIIPELQAAGVLGFEMEASAIFTVASLYGARAGCVCTVVANRDTDVFKADAGVREASLVASEAVKILSEWDDARGRLGKRWFYPSLAARST
jgi:uridine phosphorylase